MQTNFNGYEVSEEIAYKLALSLAEVEGMEAKSLLCPICDFRIEDVYEDKSGHVKVKCKKCKNELVLNLAYFRRMRRYRYTDQYYYRSYRKWYS